MEVLVQLRQEGLPAIVAIDGAQVGRGTGAPGVLGAVVQVGVVRERGRRRVVAPLQKEQAQRDQEGEGPSLAWRRLRWNSPSASLARRMTWSLSQISESAAPGTAA